MSLLLETWHTLVAVVAVGAVNNLDQVRDIYHAAREHGLNLLDDGVLTRAVIVTGVVLLAWTGFQVAVWWTRRYAVDADAVYYRTGVLVRRLRVARLVRIQSVDVVHPLAGRLLGLGRLTLEVVGGADSHVTIGYLPSRELTALREEILRLAAGGPVAVGGAVTAGGGVAAAGGGVTASEPVTTDGAVTASGSVPADGALAEVPGAPEVPTLAVSPAPSTSSTSPISPVTSASSTPSALPTPPAPLGFADALAAPVRPDGIGRVEEHDLYHVEPRILIGSLLRSIGVLSGAVGGLLLVAVSVIESATGHAGAPGGGIGQVLVIVSGLVGYLSYAWNRLRSGWGFRACATPAGIRLRYGLTDAVSVTLPPGRVHAVELSRNILWRSRDWWGVRVMLAGREGEGGDDVRSQASRLLPVGTRTDALRALWLVVPDLGVDCPDRLLASALDGRGSPTGTPEPGWTACAPRRSRWLAPLGWRCQAVALTSTCVVIRRGRWRRRVTVVPYPRIQSLRLRQGPVARRLGLAGVLLNMVDATSLMGCLVRRMDQADAARTGEMVARRALERREQEHLDRWLERAAGTAPWTGEVGGSVPEPRT
ncbi:PH domain-containing protein [Actinomyces sp. HMT897]|uniref:PH domain-containing protein n=1 Tax=Actinomyces sp. HMT897 TaxID=2789424 RepID=UPI00190E08C1|nr:PH domain-containing protein [Actinomyces sp. HMT897]QQO77278.1 PH domain-containing protein [Actinomyces sp. HMT897]